MFPELPNWVQRVATDDVACVQCILDGPLVFFSQPVSERVDQPVRGDLQVDFPSCGFQFCCRRRLTVWRKSTMEKKLNEKNSKEKNSNGNFILKIRKNLKFKIIIIVIYNK